MAFSSSFLWAFSSISKETNSRLSVAYKCISYYIT